MGLVELTQGKGWKNFMAKLYGFGASIVIIGALFKIQHWPGAGVMLTIGLGTEAIIFFFSAFEPPHEEVDWSLVYPELAGMHDEDGRKRGTVTQELDRMLEEAKIGPELIDSLGTGLKALGETTSRLTDLTDASIVTNDYIKNVKVATKSVGELSQSYVDAANALTELSTSTQDAKVYNDQIQAVGKNLAALNAIYELQLQDSSTHLKATTKFYEGIHGLMESLNSSAQDTKKYKEEVAQLAKNLSSLNTVYGNMLSAMNVNRT